MKHKTGARSLPFFRYPGGGRKLMGPVTGSNFRQGYGLCFYRLTGIGSCAYCGTDLAASYQAWLKGTLDHAVPDNLGRQLEIPEEWREDYSNRVLACGACNGFANRFEPSFKMARPTSLKGFFDLRDRLFLARRARIRKRHEEEKAFFAKHWQRRDPPRRPRTP